MCQSPGLIADLVLRRIGIRSREPRKKKRAAQDHSGVVYAGGVPVPENMPELRTMVPLYYPAQLAVIGRQLEERQLRLAGEPPELLHTRGEQPPPLVAPDDPVSSVPVSTPALPVAQPGPKEGDMCYACCMRYRWVQRGGLIRGQYPDHATDYARMWADAESGNYTASRLRQKWGELVDDHRAERAQKVYEDNHILECDCGAGDDADWSEFNIPGGLGFAY